MNNSGNTRKFRFGRWVVFFGYLAIWTNIILMFKIEFAIANTIAFVIFGMIGWFHEKTIDPFVKIILLEKKHV